MNTLAQQFKALHIPGDPLILTNAYDIPSAEAIASLPSVKALATASAGVAMSHGLQDDDLTLELNLAAVKGVVAVAKRHGKPLTEIGRAHV